jgi:hypothetical protein
MPLTTHNSEEEEEEEEGGAGLGEAKTTTPALRLPGSRAGAQLRPWGVGFFFNFFLDNASRLPGYNSTKPVVMGEVEQRIRRKIEEVALLSLMQGATR